MVWSTKLVDVSLCITLTTVKRVVAECTSWSTSNNTTTRISIQTAGLAFGGTGLCSYRVRGVVGSCAKHLTVESYVVIYAANSYIYEYYYFLNLELGDKN